MKKVMACIVAVMIFSVHGYGNADKVAMPNIGVVSSLVNVFPRTSVRPELISTIIDMQAAKGESESAQIFIAAASEPVTVRRIEISDLNYVNGQDAKIKSDNISVMLVGYANVETNSWRSIKRKGLWPDPLLDFRPFGCPARENRSLWVTVTVPRDAKAGSYKGSIRLYTWKDKLLANIPIKLKVMNFILPEKPYLYTSYWHDFESRYDINKERRQFDDMLKLFGQYRTSTNLWLNGDMPVFYLETDGRVTCNDSSIRKNILLAEADGFSTFNLGDICWADSGFKKASFIDRKTGESVSDELHKKYPGELRAKIYLNQICDWLEKKGLLERAYVQLYDEAGDPALWTSTFAKLYASYRKAEPRLKYLGLIGIHPETQGLFDIWSPHVCFYDKKTYDMIRNGIALQGKKNFPAEITASSSGGWKSPAFYQYRPIDAYDGCEYTKWIPAEKPSKGNPQWLTFNFEKPTEVNGVRIVPFVSRTPMNMWHLEGSIDGNTFVPVKLNTVKNNPDVYSFKPGKYKAMKMVWTGGERPFVANENQPIPAPTVLTLGVREVEFLNKNIPAEATLPRGTRRKAEMWEYNVGADYPSVDIDSNPAEIRANGWQCWARELTGYLNYGGAQWKGRTGQERPKGEDPLVWPAMAENGMAIIVYPGEKKVLPSIRLARFRDGVDDYDYLKMLELVDKNHPMIVELREIGRDAYRSPSSIESNRKTIASLLEKAAAEKNNSEK